MSRGSASRSDMLIVFPAFITAGCFLRKIDVDKRVFLFQQLPHLLYIILSTWPSTSPCVRKRNPCWRYAGPRRSHCTCDGAWTMKKLKIKKDIQNISLKLLNPQHWLTCMIQIYYQKEPVISAPCVHRVLAGHRVCHEQEEPQGWRRLVWEIEN